MLVVDGVHTYYGDSHVLHGVSLEVPHGRLAVVMGRNGVGKTTLIRSIMGLTPARDGTIRVEEQDVTHLPPHRIARLGVGLVPQGRHVFGSLSVLEHLTAVNRAGDGEGSWPLERVFDVFPRLRERQHQKARHLSGGEQSMLAIARALRTQPRCLLMDEPMEGLAPIFVDAVFDVVRGLKQEAGLSILLVVPEFAIAMRLADYVYVMSTGEVVFEGTPDELAQRRDVQSRYIGIGE